MQGISANEGRWKFATDSGKFESGKYSSIAVWALSGRLRVLNGTAVELGCCKDSDDGNDKEDDNVEKDADDADDADDAEDAEDADATNDLLFFDVWREDDAMLLFCNDDDCNDGANIAGELDGMIACDADVKEAAAIGCTGNVNAESLSDVANDDIDCAWCDEMTEDDEGFKKLDDDAEKIDFENKVDGKEWATDDNDDEAEIEEECWLSGCTEAIGGVLSSAIIFAETLLCEYGTEEEELENKTWSDAAWTGNCDTGANWDDTDDGNGRDEFGNCWLARSSEATSEGVWDMTEFA